MSDSYLDSLIGQMFVVGLHGSAIDRDFQELNSRYPFGGFILFERNVADRKQLKGLISGLNDCTRARHPQYGEPLICVDQEGGNLSPLKKVVTSMPGNMGLGAARDPEIARYAGYVTGRDILTLGINLNLAPVLDLARDPVNPVVSTRAFSDNPKAVAALGKAYATGLQQAGVLFAAKHFPGHGSVTEDSHTTLPVSDATIDELLRADLVPFKELMSLTNSAIMTSHVVFRKLDPDRPTPLSPVLVEEFLRGELGFDGVVITDCLEMSGIRKIGPVPEVAVMAVEAGCDLVLISHTPKLQEAAFLAVREAVRTGRISVDRIKQSVERIIRWKKAGFALTALKPEFNLTSGINLTPESIGEKVVTFAPGETPWTFGHDPIVLVVPEAKPLTPAENPSDLAILEDELRRLGAKCIRINCSMDPGPEEVNKIIALISAMTDDDAGVALVVRNPGGALKGQTALASAIQSIRNILLICVREPRETRAVQEGLSSKAPAVFTYSTEYIALSSLAQVLVGNADAKGVLPVKL
jgi:beta-N-acetylhexosaminidase